ncbi:MAG: hypothetical protein ACLFO2_02595 [Candidatus Woesearchaeota archaeon]
MGLIGYLTEIMTIPPLLHSKYGWLIDIIEYKFPLFRWGVFSVMGIIGLIVGVLNVFGVA